MYLKVEFEPGGTTEQACRDICVLATRIGFAVEGEMNGVTLIAVPGGSIEKLYREFIDCTQSSLKTRVAFS